MNNSGKSYQVKANGFEFTFTQEAIDKLDIIKKNLTTYHIIQHHRSVIAHQLETNQQSDKNFSVEIDGESFGIEIKDELDLMLEKMGFGKAIHKQVKEIKAPMPGLVLEINVKQGEEVAAGEKILILVAMKMENSIVMDYNAVIKHIAVSAGQAVEKGQILVELE